MSVKNDLNELIRKWTEIKVGSTVTEASLGEYTSTYDYSGCETCGSEITKDFDIWYKTPGDRHSNSLSVDGDPLSWLAGTLLPFEETITDYNERL